MKFERLWKRSQPPLIGLDIGSHAAKAVLLSQTTEGWMVEHATQVLIPAEAVSEHEIKDFEAVGNALKPLLTRLGKKNHLVAAAVAGSSVITKIIYVDGGGSEADLEAQVQIEADHLIPFPLEEVSLDFEVKGENSADASRIDILLSACRTEHVESRVAALETAGYTPKVMDIEAFALGRTLPLMNSQFPEDMPQNTVAMVDIGANMMLFTIVSNGETIYNREQPFGGEQFNQAVVGYYGMEPAAVETAKLEGALPANYDFEVLAPFQTQMVQQIRRNIQIFSTSSGINEIDMLVLSGGSAILPGTVELLREELSVHAVLANPFVGMEISPNLDQSKLNETAHQYVIACGLAMRGHSE
ncbi:pilus assembly protein PilM [Neiella marina]|uniref:Pilus assembly protein PilM n=1 Tax=Neiella holothuriorum TaxID=2870530 RepID=A0ABS7ECG2_9GAMM|nr:pilus assembly protein PilM [Neiella holothuriorum]MBW8190023.1 pilus assembly protein PilM [Neiella holothuriorum]